MRAILILSLTMIFFGSVVTAGTLEDVKARGKLRCVVTTGPPGFAAPDANGVWRGFDWDFCRATAAAVLGDANAVDPITSTGKTRFTKLNAGEGDVLWRNTTITFSRDVSVKLRFLGVNYYDGQGFMVSKSLGVSSAKELDGASVCIQTGTTTELNLADFFSSNNMSYEAVTIETNDEARQNYEAGRCDIYTTDASGLASTRSSLPNPNDHMVLPEIISKEPLGPAVRQGDDGVCLPVLGDPAAPGAGRRQVLRPARRVRRAGRRRNPDLSFTMGFPIVIPLNSSPRRTFL